MFRGTGDGRSKVLTTILLFFSIADRQNLENILKIRDQLVGNVPVTGTRREDGGGGGGGGWRGE